MPNNHPITKEPHQLIVTDTWGFVQLWKHLPVVEGFLDASSDTSGAVEILVNMINATFLYQVTRENISLYRKNAYKSMLAIQVELTLPEGTQRILLYVPVFQEEEAQSL